MVADSPVTDKTLDYLETLIDERYENPPSREKLPQTQRAASAMIQTVKQYPALAATEEQLDEIKQLASDLGETYEIKDKAHANRILFSLRRRVNSLAWQAAKKQAQEELDVLFPPAKAA